MSTVLCVVAHPDDETLGCGGTLARLSLEGHRVRAVALGDGVTSRTEYPRDAVWRRQAQFAAACATLGIVGEREPASQLWPDQRFDEGPFLYLARRVEAMLADYQPDVVYTHSLADLNLDHQLVHRAVLTALRPTPGQRVRAVYACEVPSSTEWNSVHATPFRPAAFVDISGTLPLKLSAMACYADEQPAFPHPRSKEALLALATYRGASAGVTAAEAFEVVRMVR